MEGANTNPKGSPAAWYGYRVSSAGSATAWPLRHAHTLWWGLVQRTQLDDAIAPRACAPPCPAGLLNGPARACSAEGRRAPARTRTAEPRVNPRVGREMKPRALLLRLAPPIPGSSEQSSEHSALESNLYYNLSQAASSAAAAAVAAAAAAIRIDLRLPGRSPGSSEQSSEHSALESNLAKVAMLPLLEHFYRKSWFSGWSTTFHSGSPDFATRNFRSGLHSRKPFGALGVRTLQP